MKELVQKSTLTKGKKQEDYSIHPPNQQIPNSMILAALNRRAAENGPASAAPHKTMELKNAIRSRLPESIDPSRTQIPAAEQEADRLSAHMQDLTPSAVKESMGRRLGADFSGVRFHVDPANAARVDAMKARAYTAGNDIYFGRQGFEPDIAAHELVHTVQQGAAPASSLTVSAPLGGVQMWPWSKKKQEETPPKTESGGKSLWDKTKAGASNLWGKTKTGASALWDKTKTGAKSIYDKGMGLKDKAMNAVGGVGEGLIDKVAGSEAMGKVVKKSDGFFSGIFDWADKRSGEKIDPAASESEDLGLADLFQEPEPEKESKLPKWMQSMGKGIGKAASWVGNKVKAGGNFVVDKVAGGLSALKRGNDRAVDQLNNHREDYDQMSGWDKFMWSVKNPLARLTAEHRKEGTKSRNARNAQIESLAGDYRQGLTGDMRTAAFQRSQESGSHPGEAEESSLSTVSSLLGTASSGAGALGGDLEEHYKALHGDPNASLMSGREQGFGAAGSIFEGMQGITDTVESGTEAYKRLKMGDRAGAASTSLKTLGKAASVGKSALTAAQYIAPVATEVLGNVTPGIDIGINGLDTAAEGIQAVASGIRMKKMGDRSKAYEERVKKGEKLGARDEKMRRIARQGKGAAKADVTQHTTAAIGSGLKTAGGISTIAGAPPLIGTALSAVGSGVSAIGGMVADSQRSDVRSQVVEEELELTKRMERIKKKHPNLSEREVKHVALKGLGFSSGRRTEAAQHFTIDRADFLAQNATSGDSEAEGMLSDMGVRKTKAGYNRELIGERLGMIGSGTLEQQKQVTIDSRRNPFARKKKSA